MRRYSRRHGSEELPTLVPPSPNVAEPARLGTMTVAGVRALQGLAGNRAVARLLVGRHGVTPAVTTVQRHPDLESDQLAGSTRLVAAHQNTPPLSAADQRSDVALFQHALAEVGSRPARSAGEFDGFDGIWGPATTKAVHDFQQQHGVRPVGGWEAGAKTFSALDALLLARPSPQAEDLPLLPQDPESRFDRRSGPTDIEVSAADGLPVQLQPAAPKVCDPPKNNLDAAVRTAQRESPSFARALARVRRRGFEIVHGDPKSSETNIAERKVFIACDATQDEAVIRVIYEVNNADNEVVFQQSRNLAKFPNGDAYAKEVIDEESITVMHAARMAEEAHRVYSQKIQNLIKPFLEQTPDGLNFKRGTLDKVHKLVFDEMFANGKTEKGEFARDAYRRKWEAFKKLNP